MNNIPILVALKARLFLIILFLGLSFLTSLFTWSWVLLGWFDFSIESAIQLTVEALLGTEDGKSIVLIFGGCGVFGILFTSVMYLLASLWWRKSGDVHRRGTQFIDAREGRS